MDNIYITQYSIGFLSPAILALIISGAIILRQMKGGAFTSDRVSLALYFLGASAYNILNFLGYSIYSVKAQAVWYVETFAPFVVLFLVRFAYSYPFSWREKERSVVLFSGFVIASAAVAEYWINSWNSPVRLFGHNYGAEYFSTYVPLANAFFYLWGVIVFIRRAADHEKMNDAGGAFLKAVINPRTTDGRTARTFACLMLLDIMHSFIVYGGMIRIPVSIFVISFTTTVVILIILSLYTIVYLHSAYDNIPFIYRLTGIPLIIVTVIITASGYMVMYFRSISYDEMNRAVISELRIDEIHGRDKKEFPVSYISYAANNAWTVVYRKTGDIPGIINSGLWKESPSGMQVKTSAGIETSDKIAPEGRYFVQINGVNYYQYNRRIGEKVYGFGIPYIAYLKYMHKTGNYIVALIAVSMLIIITLLPLLYYVGIINPIRRIVRGTAENALPVTLFENERNFMESIIKSRQTVSRGKSLPENPDEISSAMRVKLNQIIDFIKNNYRDDISREGLASMVDLDPDYAGKLFRIYTGMKIGDYINKLRIDEACSLLADGEKTVLEISMIAGFESLRTFNRIFFRITGETPTSYRTKKRI